MDLRALSQNLTELSTALVHYRTAASDSAAASTSKASLFHAAAAPLFAALNAQNRLSHLESQKAKATTQQARLELESRWLRLQNLKFEQHHLEKEIKSCQDYFPVYQSLPLPTPGEFLALYESHRPQDTPEQGRLPLLSQAAKLDDHEVQLAILRHEVDERQRLETLKKAFSAEKQALIKSNLARKVILDDLEKRLERFVNDGKVIQASMHQVKEMDDPSLVRTQHAQEQVTV